MAKGLGLIYISICIILLSAILIGILGGVTGAMGAQRGARAMQPGEAFPRPEFGGMAIVMLLCGLGLIVGYTLGLIGTFMCLATPQETGAKGLITTSVVLMVIALVMTIANVAVENMALAGLANILSVAGGIAFILFLKKLAEFIGAIHLARRAQSILIALVVGVGLLIVSLGIAVTGGGAAIIAGLVIFVLMIGGLVVFVMYANLINNLRKAIQSGGASYV
ncbi:MAG: hypothetical protein WD894_10930 [Pirellulales bacterium]